ncbi:MAG: [FeFe] hydrogenase H-cluster radical SAM maturase HydG, partial [Firmicutes bacterium]|nr:[FeFe] hydrogenase H-cluster radical SAM maturase HydG [Bacillota bacterium]
VGISQIDAGSRIAIGGYEKMEQEHIPDREQFQLGDTRSLDKCVQELCTDGYIPSFCTAGYRCGRTGEHFMTLAKRGDVKNFCTPNAVLTFKEYLLDYASPETKEAGSQVIDQYVKSITAARPQQAQRLQQLLTRLEAGERDLYI